MNNQFFLFLLICIGFSSCKTLTLKKTTKKASTAFLKDAIDHSHFDFTTFKGKAHVQYNDGKNNQNFTLNIRMRKDSIIWLSASLFGIEGIRAVLTQDSVKIIDRLGKSYTQLPVQQLQQKLKLPSVSFSTLQDIIVGNVLYYQNPQKSTSSIDSIYYLLTMLTGNYSNKIWLSSSDYTVQRNFIQDQTYNQSIDVIYQEYKSIEKQPFSHKRSILIKRGVLTNSANLDFQKVEINKPTSYPFNIPNKYAGN